MRAARSHVVRTAVRARRQPHPFHPGHRQYASGTQSPAPDPDPNPRPDYATAGEDGAKESWRHTAWKMFESAATTAASISVLGLVGYSYTLYYKQHVLRKMEQAFEPGDPVLDLIGHKATALPSSDVHDESDENDRDHWL